MAKWESTGEKGAQMKQWWHLVAEKRSMLASIPSVANKQNMWVRSEDMYSEESLKH